jgi:hypothetical protein
MEMIRKTHDLMDEKILKQFDKIIPRLKLIILMGNRG